MMTKAKLEKRKKARELRRQGWAYSDIVQELDVSKGSVSNWCKDIELTDEQYAALKERQIQLGEANKGAKHNKRVALEQRRIYQQAGREKAREMSKLHIIGCMLYWAEGARYRRNVVHFANSDPEMMLVFMRFLREEMNVDDEMLSLQIHCYAETDDEQNTIEQYWLNLLNLSRSCLHKTQILKGSNKKTNRLTNGVAAIRISSTELLQHILGAIQEYGNFENEEWLF